MIKKLILSIFLFTTLLLPLHAFATTVTVSTVSGQNASFNYTFGGSGSGWAGEIGASFNDSDFVTFAYCVDIHTGISASTYTVEGYSNVSTYDDGHFSATGNGLKAAWLMNQYSSGLGYTGYASGEQNASEAGLQLAIWEALYGDGFSITLPSVTSSWTTDKALHYYNLYNDGLTGADFSNFTGKNFRIAKLKDAQDLIIYNPVPEPATMLLFWIGLLGISAVGRKKRA